MPRRALANCSTASGCCPAPLRIPTSSPARSEEHTSELQSRGHLVCRLLLEKKNFLPLLIAYTFHKFSNKPHDRFCIFANELISLRDFIVRMCLAQNRGIVKLGRSLFDRMQ